MASANEDFSLHAGALKAKEGPLILFVFLVKGRCLTREIKAISAAF